MKELDLTDHVKVVQLSEQGKSSRQITLDLSVGKHKYRKQAWSTVVGGAFSL